MIKIILCGCNGTMGKIITEFYSNSNEIKIIAGVSRKINNCLYYPVYKNILDIKDNADLILDFSYTELIYDILKYSEIKKIPSVICTTGYSDEQIKLIQNHSKNLPVFFSYNTSIAITLMSYCANKIASILYDDFDIEIIEKHHNKKIDSPSGTALFLADEIKNTINNYDTNYVYKFDRHKEKHKRDKEEIGIHSIRAGGIVGQHKIVFASENEMVTLSHTAFSKKLFANGTKKAIKFIINKKNGIYTTKDLIK